MAYNVSFHQLLLLRCMHNNKHPQKKERDFNTSPEGSLSVCERLSHSFSFFSQVFIHPSFARAGPQSVWQQQAQQQSRLERTRGHTREL